MHPHSQTPLHHQPNIDLLALMPTSASIVEAGCSSGALAAAYKLKNPSCRYVGIEIDSKYAEIARSHCDEVLVADLDALAHCSMAKQLQSDCWVFGDCLEHLANPWQVLRWVNQHQPASGLICACIPNSQHWSMQCRLSVGQWVYEPSGLLDRTHLRFFTASTISHLFVQAGYEIIVFKPRILGSAPSNEILNAIGALSRLAGGDPEHAINHALPLQYLVVARKV